MKSMIKRLLSSAALFVGVTFGASQASAYPFYYEDTFEEQLWAYAEFIDSIDGYAVFLNQFGSSEFAGDARARLAILASDGQNRSGAQIQLLVTKRERGLLGVFASENADPYVRSFDLFYAG